jgi:hypothetical protein
MDTMPTTTDKPRFTRAKIGIALFIAAVSLLLFASEFLEWHYALPMPGSQIVSAVRQPKEYRAFTHRRYKSEVRCSTRLFTGFFDSYWYVGAPTPGEVVDLRRADHGSYQRFHYDRWTREFRDWFVFLLVAAALTPAYLAIFRSLERYERRVAAYRKAH